MLDFDLFPVLNLEESCLEWLRLKLMKQSYLNHYQIEYGERN